ncbi:hypothetical protein ACTACD_02755 [Pseudomonas syringae]|uniref:hypothetical protein n=1 Tax=Pseudomonas syringae TaxID=317 RepID=UPI003F767A0F
MYQYNTGIYKREVLAMNLAGQMAQLGEEESGRPVAQDQVGQLLKLVASGIWVCACSQE